MIGRPPLTPRIEELEKRVADLENAVLELAGVRFPKPELKSENGYEPLFNHWPGKS